MSPPQSIDAIILLSPAAEVTLTIYQSAHQIPFPDILCCAPMPSQFFSRLYQLLQPGSFTTKHRVTFFRLADLFLSSGEQHILSMFNAKLGGCTLDVCWCMSELPLPTVISFEVCNDKLPAKSVASWWP